MRVRLRQLREAASAARRVRRTGGRACDAASAVIGVPPGRWGREVGPGGRLLEVIAGLKGLGEPLALGGKTVPVLPFRDRKQNDRKNQEETVEENELTILRIWGKNQSRDILKGLSTT
ncbi:uncharacterized protein LOC143683544 [Tamandua tetradactyla]|uniref:uncharacterized protein LOC143683544 n=1 Tax=Tamandua tetradactyla TaxID=48850 RepID=UPI0040545E04